MYVLLLRLNVFIISAPVKKLLFVKDFGLVDQDEIQSRDLLVFELMVQNEVILNGNDRDGCFLLFVLFWSKFKLKFLYSFLSPNNQDILEKSNKTINKSLLKTFKA